MPDVTGQMDDRVRGDVVGTAGGRGCVRGEEGFQAIQSWLRLLVLT